MKFLKLAIFLLLSLTVLSCNEAKKADGKNRKEQTTKKKNKNKEDSNEGKKKEEEKKKEIVSYPYSAKSTILQTWELPPILKEISGICMFEENKIAAVQDELGIIYIYNLNDSKIEREISFGPKGDYEGITHTSESFYVLRVDGTVFEVPKSGKAFKEYDTHLELKDDTEGIVYDSKKGRLLISLKASKDSINSKDIYAFSLKTFKLSEKPVFSINTSDTIFNIGNGLKKNNNFQPAEITIHPKTGELYLTGGTNSSVLILDSSAKTQYYTLLNPSDIEQPEGIAISRTGELYIASEGVKQPAKILKVKLIN